MNAEQYLKRIENKKLNSTPLYSRKEMIDFAEKYAKQLTLTDVSSSYKCSRCEINDAQSEHTCPYAEEINNDSDNLCDCCSDCEHECCMDI
jgi:hypothetical protein